MAQLLISVSIDAPAEAIWPWIADLTKHAEWSPKPYTVQLTSGTAGEVGSTYSSVGFVPPSDKNHKNEVEITQVTPFSKFIFRSHDENGYFINTFTLKAVGNSTEVTFQHDFPKMKGAGRILLPLLLPSVGKRDGLVRLGMLKAKAEGK